MYINDILVCLALEEHAYPLRTTLEVLRKNELYVMLNKCEFWLEKVAFFGHVVSREGIFVDPQKVEAIT